VQRFPPGKRPSILFWNGLGLLCLILVWSIAASIVGSELILPSPIQTLMSLARLCQEDRFWYSIGRTALRVISAIGLAIPLSLAIGLSAGLVPRFRAFLQPWLTTVSATPVLAIILLALLWVGPEKVPVLVSLLVLLPVLTGNVIEGVLSTDKNLLEAARAFRFPRRDLLRHVYLPSMRPFLVAGVRTATSLAWKAVVAAEVIAQPRFALGAGMQRAKAQLETPDLFAWTVSTVFLAWVTDLLLATAARRFGGPDA